MIDRLDLLHPIGVNYYSAFQPERATADKPIRILRATFRTLKLAYRRPGGGDPFWWKVKLLIDHLK